MNVQIFYEQIKFYLIAIFFSFLIHQIRFATLNSKDANQATLFISHLKHVLESRLSSPILLHLVPSSKVYVGELLLMMVLRDARM